jgi:hypothetical protein
MDYATRFDGVKAAKIRNFGIRKIVNFRFRRDLETPDEAAGADAAGRFRLQSSMANRTSVIPSGR